MVAAVVTGQPLLWAVSANGSVKHAMRERVRNEFISSSDGQHLYVDNGYAFCGAQIDLKRAQSEGVDDYEPCATCTLALSRMHRRMERQ